MPHVVWSHSLISRVVEIVIMAEQDFKHGKRVCKSHAKSHIHVINKLIARTFFVRVTCIASIFLPIYMSRKHDYQRGSDRFNNDRFNNVRFSSDRRAVQKQALINGNLISFWHIKNDLQSPALLWGRRIHNLSPHLRRSS